VKDKPLADQNLPGGDGNGTASQCTLPRSAAGDPENVRLGWNNRRNKDASRSLNREGARYVAYLRGQVSSVYPV